MYLQIYIVISESEKQALVQRHNQLRGHVGDNDAGGKTASNMMKLVNDNKFTLM